MVEATRRFQTSYAERVNTGEHKMSLKDKLSKVNVGKIAADGAARRKDGHAPEAQKTAIGFHVDSIYSDRKIAEENKLLKESVAKYEGSEPTKKLDPKSIRSSHWANRSEDSFKSKKFEEFKSEIASAGGNVQPIKVRPIAGVKEEYEIVFGHRRHRACLDLGLLVLALIEDVNDTELFTQMDRENRQRADLRPYEQGVMYARALDEGLFPSMRKMAESMGVSVAGVSKVVTLSKLPADILNAFETPLDIQFDWGSAIGSALQKNPDFVLSRAREIATHKPRPGASQVFKELMSKEGVKSLNTPKVVTGKDGATGKICFNEKRRSFEISLMGLGAKRLTDIEKAIKALLN